MWICRRCAAHVKEDVLKCPCCETPGPARLHPELVEHVSTDTDASSRWEEPSLLVRGAVPLLERQIAKRAVEVGALIGFTAPLLLGLVTVFHGYSEGWTCGRLLGEFVLILAGSLFCGVFGALTGGCLVVVLRPLSNLMAKWCGRETASPLLPPRSALAKTEAIGQHPPTRSDHSDQIAAGSEQLPSQSVSHLDSHRATEQVWPGSSL